MFGNNVQIGRMVSGIARRLASVGIRIDRSPRSESIYARVGTLRCRISGHDLGWADYGTRPQSHNGPEVVFDEPVATVEALRLICRAVREVAESVAHPVERRLLADDLRRLRRAMDRARRNAARDARAAERRAAARAAKPSRLVLRWERERALQAAVDAARADRLARGNAALDALLAAGDARAARHEDQIRALIRNWASAPTPGRTQSLTQFGLVGL